MSAVLDLLLNYWEIGVGFLALFLAAYWWFDERDQSDSVGDAIERVGRRAEVATGGVVGAAGSLAVVVIAILSTIGDELVMSGMQIAGILGSDPVLSGGVLTGILGVLGMNGTVSIATWQYAVVVVALLVVAVVWRANHAAD
ncbi:hypothetical protein VB779_09350 [Haloarculaceae archaeon H-GB11]|nr:hypothetical protein [Haloarculaceae archaeon H-GB11]